MGFATGLCLSSVCHDQPGLGEGEGLELTLIAPFWPQRPWFPELLILPPLPLPSWWDLLYQPQARRFHQNLSMLRLHAWRDSGDLQEPSASLVAWLDDLSRRGGSFQ